MSEPPEDTRPLFLRELRPLPTIREPITNGVAPGQNTPYVRAAFAAELAALQATPEGERNAQLNIAAMKLGQLVASGHLPELDVRAALFDMGVQVGLTETETRATLASGIAKGLTEPRAVPAPSSPTVYPEVTVLERPIGLELEPGEETKTTRELYPEVDWPTFWADQTEEEWIIHPLLPARRLVALYSAPKVGKSLLMLELAVAVARGEKFLGTVPDRPRRVLYVDFENDLQGDVRTRLEAMGLGPGDDLSRLSYHSFPRLPYLDTVMGGLTLLELVREYDVEVVVIDTISRIVAGEENDNDTWLAFYRHTGLALKAAGIATIRLDHTGKDATKGMRGGSAKYGDVDAVWSMTLLDDDRLQLECTANRLPVSPKVLVIERKTEPLRHEVRETGRAAALTSEAARCAAQLHKLGVDPAAGFPTVKAALERAQLYQEGRIKVPGKFAKGTVEQAMVHRQEEARQGLDWSPSGQLEET